MLKKYVKLEETYVYKIVILLILILFAGCASQTLITDSVSDVARMGYKIIHIDTIKTLDGNKYKINYK
jgi:hypothetical protein